MAVVACSTCGAPVQRKPREIEKYAHTFCGRACKGSWMSTQVGAAAIRYNPQKPTIPCAQCGFPLRPAPGKLLRNKRHFCPGKVCISAWRVANKAAPRRPSHADARSHMRGSVSVPCAHCGTQLWRAPYRLKEYARHYCGMACRSAYKAEHFSGQNSWAWRGGTVVYYGPNWQRQRAAARSRDGHRCRKCGADEAANGRKMEVHHIKPFRLFGYVPGVNSYYKQANRLENLVSLCRGCHRGAEPKNAMGLLPLFPQTAREVRMAALRARTEKRCPRCATVKPLTDFHRKKNRPDGHYGFCKPCACAAVAASKARSRGTAE